MIILGIFTKIIRALVTAIIPTTDPYWDNVVLSLRMESSDPYYNQVVLLMHMDDTGLTDVKGKTITLGGNASRSATQSKFGGYSAYFDGTGDYLGIPDSNDFHFGSGDFTIELWVYITTLAQSVFISQWDADPKSSWIFMTDGDGVLSLSYTTSGFYQAGNVALSAAGTITANVWTHVAASRVGNTLTLYKNGLAVATKDVAGISFYNPDTQIRVGLTTSNLFPLTGYIDDLRITKGVGRYTKNFSIPTAAFPEPVNTAIDDKGNTITTNGNAQYSGTSKYGSGSFYFDGTGDYLTVPNSTDFDFGTSDFTIEFWINTVAVNATLIGKRPNVSWGPFVLGINTNKLQVRLGTSAGSFAVDITSTDSINTGLWVHVAVTRASSTVRMFVNGVVQSSTATLASALYVITDPVYIGSNSDGTGGFLGYIDDVRITKGVARYTSNFTPYQIKTTAPAGDPFYNYTTLLLKMNGTNGGTTFTDNSYSPKTVTRYGSVVTSTGAIKYGSASCYSPGTLGNYLTVPKTTAFDFGSGDFTIELWAYLISLNANTQAIFSTGKTSGTDYFSLRFAVNSTGYLSVNFSNNGTSITLSLVDPSTFSLSTWQHIALTRRGDTFNLWKNGISVALGTMTGSIYYSTSDPVCIGTDPAYGGTGYLNNWNGYKDDLRVTKGFARYTTTFQPPGPHIAAIDPDTDQWWLNTVLALRMDGIHGSTTFTDLTGKTVTANGNASISSAVSKFGQAGYFDGTGDYLSITDSSDMYVETGDFTIECWFYLSSYPASGNYFVIASKWLSNNSRWCIYLGENVTTDSGLHILLGNGSTVTAAGHTPTTATLSSLGISVGTWYHMAAVRSSGVVTVYLNGTALSAQPTITYNASYPGVPVQIGVQNNSLFFNGYIDDFRFTKGIARYTATFTPSEKPLPTYVVGPDHDQYWDKVVLALPFDNNLTDARAHTITANGNASISTTQKMFGKGSCYFDGSGDYLSLTNSGELSLGSSDFTIEAWVYFNSVSGIQIILDGRGIVTDIPCAYVFYLNAGKIVFGADSSVYGVTGTPWDILLTSISTQSLNNWHHVAISRSSTSWKLFIDGVVEASATITLTIGNAAPTMYIGSGVNGAGTLGYAFNGYIDDLRVTKGIARYTANFELPTVANILG